VEVKSQIALIGDRQFKELERQIETIQQQINRTDQVKQLGTAAGQMNQLRQRWEEAKQQKWQEEQEAKRQQEIDRQAIALEVCEQRLAPWLTDAQKFVPQDLASLQQSFSQLRDLIQQGNPQTVQSPLATCQQTLIQYLATVEQAKAQWQARQAQAMTELGQIQALLAGLQADPVVMRW
jgi:hypothetical protein